MAFDCNGKVLNRAVNSILQSSFNWYCKQVCLLVQFNLVSGTLCLCALLHEKCLIIWINTTLKCYYSNCFFESSNKTHSCSSLFLKDQKIKISLKQTKFWVSSYCSASTFKHIGTCIIAATNTASRHTL